MTIISLPQYPVVDEEVTLSLSAALGTAAAFELRGVPSTSALATGLILKEQAPGGVVPVSPVIAANEDLTIDTFTPDVPGEYSFAAFDLRRIVGVPAFEGDPNADDRFEVLGTQVGIVHVGTLMSLPVVTSDGHGGTIEIRVIQDSIRGVEIVDTTSEIGRLSAIQPSVVAAMASVVGLSADVASTDFLEALRDIRDRYNGNDLAQPNGIKGHRRLAFVIPPTLPWPPANRVHHERDNVNVLDSGIPYSLKYAVKLVNELREMLIGHFEGSIKYATIVQPQGGPIPPYDHQDFWHFSSQSEATTPGSGGAPWFGKVVPGVDSTCTPIIGQASDLPTATVLLCELRLRAYTRHIHLGHGSGSHPWLAAGSRSAPHGAPDTDSRLTVPPSPIDTVIVEYLDTIIRMDPSFAPPSPEGAGLANMAHKYGFKVKGT